MALSKPWHKLSKDEMGKAVQGLVDTYRTEQAGRRSRYVRNLENYEGRSMSGYSAYTYNDDPHENDEVFRRDRLRLFRSAVSSAVSSIYGPQKPKPQFQTLGATWAIRRKAYKLDRICEGIINQRQERWINVWAFMIDAGVECAIQGIAPIKVIADIENQRICHKLIPHPELYTDPAEGRNPKNLFQREPIDESTAYELWPQAETAIIAAKEYDWFGQKGEKSAKPRESRVIELQYAWRLPFSKDKPGRWCAVINGTVVDDGEWEAPAFPFVNLIWEPHRDGYWAAGLGDEAAGMALECSELDHRLLIRQILASGKKGWYHEGAVISPESLESNEAIEWIKLTNGAQFPQETLVPPFSPMELDYLNTKVRNFWDAIGISQVSAAARREQGVDSGVAMMTLNDTKAGRQLIKAQRYEQAFVDLSHQYVWRLREIADKDKDFVVTWPGKTLLRQVKWTDADTDDDQFSVTVAPASSLPHDPAGRQQMVSSLLQSQIISPETAKSLIGWPDLDAELDVENAEFEYIDMLIERYLDAEKETWSDGDYDAAVAFIGDKFGALRRFASAWFRANIDQQALPAEERVKVELPLSLLERYIKELDKLMLPPPAPAPTGPVPAAALPGGAPMPPPVPPMPAPPMAA